MTELGTEEYPFKELSIPLILIQNFAEFQDINITLYLIEHSISYLAPDIAYIVGLNTVTLEAYTPSLGTSDFATIRFEDGFLPSFSPKSKLVLLSDLSLDNMQRPGISILESALLAQRGMGFHIFKTNFVIKKIDFQSKVSGNDDFTIFNPIFLEDKTVNLDHVQIAGSGGILLSLYPLNLEVTNTKIDYSLLSSGFVVQGI